MRDGRAEGADGVADPVNLISDRPAASIFKLTHYLLLRKYAFTLLRRGFAFKVLTRGWQIYL
jgi:hypothetical protein